MPARNISLDLQTGELLHEAVADLSKAEHFTLSFFRKNEAGEYVPTSGFLAYEACYVKVEIADPELAEDYILTDLKITYKYYTGSPSSMDTESRSIISKAAYDAYGINGLNEDGYYDFKLLYSTGMHMVSSGDDAKVTVSATEKCVSTYKGESFVGRYLGVESYGVRNTNSFNSSYSPTIDGAGEFKLAGTTYKIFNVDRDAGMFDVGYATAESANGKMAFNDKLIIAHYNIAADIVKLNAADVMMAIKPQEGDADDLYSVAAESFKIDGHQYIVAEFLRDGASYANVFVDAATQEYFIDGVEFDMISGTKITDAMASYSVKVNGVTKLSVGSTSTGGPENRILLDGLQGDWTVGDKVLSLDGISAATYDGNAYDYTVENGKVVAKRTEITDEGGVSWTLTFALDESARTATLESTDSVVSPYVVNLNSETTALPSSSYSYRHFSETSDGIYEASVSAQYGVIEMAITACKDGKLTFNVACGKYVSYSTSYFYATVYVNGVALPGYESVGDSSSTSSSAAATAVEAFVKKGDVVTVAYFCKSTSDYYVPSFKKVVVSDINLLNGGAEAGNYTVDDLTVSLDGWGHGYCGNATFDYTVPEGGDPFVVEFDLPLVEDDGVTPRHFEVTLDVSAKTGIATITPGEKINAFYVVDNETLDTGLTFSRTSYVQPNYHFTDNGDGSYTSANATKGSTTAEITLVAMADGKLTFDLTGGGEANWDVTRIFINGVAYTDFTALDYGDQTVEIMVAAGDRVQICFSKDSSTDRGADSVTISNIDLVRA